MISLRPRFVTAAAISGGKFCGIVFDPELWLATVARHRQPVSEAGQRSLGPAIRTGVSGDPTSIESFPEVPTRKSSKERPVPLGSWRTLLVVRVAAFNITVSPNSPNSAAEAISTLFIFPSAKPQIVKTAIV